MFGLNLRQRFQLLFERGKNLDSLDRIDTKIGIDLHVELEHFSRIPGLGRHNLNESRFNLFVRQEFACPRTIWLIIKRRPSSARLLRFLPRRFNAALRDKLHHVTQVLKRAQMLRLNRR